MYSHKFTLAEVERKEPIPLLKNGWVALFYPLEQDTFKDLNIHLDQYGKWMTLTNAVSGSTGKFYDIHGGFNNFGGWPVSMNVNFDADIGPNKTKGDFPTFYGRNKGSQLLFKNSGGFIDGIFPSTFDVSDLVAVAPYTIRVDSTKQEYEKSDPTFATPYGIYNCTGTWETKQDRSYCEVGATFEYSYNNIGNLVVEGTVAQSIPEHVNSGYSFFGNTVIKFTDSAGAVVEVVDAPLESLTLPETDTLTKLKRRSWQGLVELSQTPRTNICPQSTPRTEGWWWTDGGADITSTTLGPDGLPSPVITPSLTNDWTGLVCGYPSSDKAPTSLYFDLKPMATGAEHNELRVGRSDGSKVANINLLTKTVKTSDFDNIEFIDLPNGFVRVHMWGEPMLPGVGLGVHAEYVGCGPFAWSGVMDSVEPYGEYIPTDGDTKTRIDFTINENHAIMVDTGATDSLFWSGLTKSESDGRTVIQEYTTLDSEALAKSFVETEYGAPLPAGSTGFFTVDVKAIYKDRLKITSADDGRFDWSKLPQEDLPRVTWSGLVVESDMSIKAKYLVSTINN